jgi:hypothetical protein
MGMIIGIGFRRRVRGHCAAAGGDGAGQQRQAGAGHAGLGAGHRKPGMREQRSESAQERTLSSIPWLNKKLLKFELAPYLRKMLSQADLNWSAGGLLLVCAACLRPGLRAYWKTGNILAGAGGGGRCWACCPSALCCSSAAGASAHSKRAAGGAGPDGERAARRAQPARGHGPGGARVPDPGGHRIQDLL